MANPREFYQGLDRVLDTKIDKVQPWRATVTTVDTNGLVTVTPSGSTVEMTEKIPSFTPFRLHPSDEVLVMPIGGSYAVIGFLPFGIPITLTYETNMTVKGSLAAYVGSNAVLETVSGTLADGLYLRGEVIGTSLAGASTWGITNAGAVTATSFNSPIIHTEAASTATNSSTTSTASYVSAMTDPITLPTGTWTVYMLGGVALTHSTGGTVNMLLTINGNDGTARALAASSTTQQQIISEHIVSGVTGSFNAVVNYKSNTAGTTSARNPWSIVVATRTA